MKAILPPGVAAAFHQPRLVLVLIALFLIPSVQAARAAAPDRPSRAQTSMLADATRKEGASSTVAESFAQAVAATITERAKLTPPYNGFQNYFGHAVSLRGNRALVGAFSSDANGDQMGHAYIFSFDGATWTQEADLTPSDATVGDDFGLSVSLSGSRALVGGGANAAYVFAFDGTTWNQQAKLTPSGGAVYFGISVSLSGDTALVGDHYINGAKGAAYIYSFNGQTWRQQAKLTASNGAKNDYFGTSVSLSGGRAAVGAEESGSAYIFARNGSTWSQEAELIPSDGEKDQLFGWSVSLTGDRVLVGAPGATGIMGAAYLFAFDGATWTQQTKLTPSDGEENDQFGDSVSLLGDHALVGAWGAADNKGAAYLFTLDGTTWTQQAKLVASDGATGDEFGTSVSLSAGRALVGARNNVGMGYLSGAAYIFGH